MKSYCFEYIPWDSEAIGLDAYEIRNISKEKLEYIENTKGHFTARVHPLSDKKHLHEYGFYYCDTLIEPYCLKENLIHYVNENMAVRNSDHNSIDKLCSIALTSFEYDRFHRDFNIIKEYSNIRYSIWLKELHKNRKVLSLLYGDEIIGFFAYINNKAVLHALKKEYQGKGYAKYFWSLAFKIIFSMGYEEVTSSISASNLAVLNVYSRLGFKFRNQVDIYHKLNI